MHTAREEELGIPKIGDLSPFQGSGAHSPTWNYLTMKKNHKYLVSGATHRGGKDPLSPKTSLLGGHQLTKDLHFLGNNKDNRQRASVSLLT